jgi:hypothetical protein
MAGLNLHHRDMPLLKMTEKRKVKILPATGHGSL